MQGSLVVDLRDAYEQAARVTPKVARARVISNTRRGQRALKLLALVELYRAGPRQIWAPVLLDMLAPGLLIRLQRLRAEPPYVDEEDLRQQLVLELLEAAGRMPLPRDPMFLRRRLLARANQGVRRSLGREHRRQSRQIAYELREGQRP